MARARVNSYGVSGRSADVASPTRWATVAAVACCGVLLCVFAVTSWAAVMRKSAAVDEPTRAVAAWMHLARGDFRVNPQDPPLWKFLAARTNARVELPVDRHPQLWSGVLTDASESEAWSRAVLYGTAGGAAAADAILARSRAVMLLIAVGLGAMIGWWAWKIAGPVAAVVAVALYSLDPNFVAHGPLLDSDVAMSLAMLATVYAAWRAGRRASLPRILILAALAGVTLSLKFSGLFVLVIVSAVVGSRVFVPAGWPLFRDSLRKWWGRYVVAGILVLAMWAVGVATLWATYGFRFRPAPDVASAMNMRGLADEVAATEAPLASRGNRMLATQPSPVPSLPVRVAMKADAHRLFPQAWIYGLLDAYQGTLPRSALLLGKTRRGGSWSYFPFAAALKAPLAMLAAIGLGAWVLVSALKRGGMPGEAATWTITCLALPVLLYWFFATLARLDFGIRHALPAYPFLFIGMGVAAALAAQRWRSAKWVAALLIVGIGVETLRAFPNYVPFFNAAATAWRHGVYFLGESNVDLGQDLPLLAEWQAQNASRKLYLSYRGGADPAAYGITATDVLASAAAASPEVPVDPAGVLAVSATHLQGFAIPPLARTFYAQLRKRQPFAVLGGSIYLFDLAPQDYEPRVSP